MFCVNHDGKSLKYHTEYINPRLIDKTKRTCPSMAEIVNRYNLHYSQFHYNHQDGYYDENASLVKCQGMDVVQL